MLALDLPGFQVQPHEGSPHSWVPRSALPMLLCTGELQPCTPHQHACQGLLMPSPGQAAVKAQHLLWLAQVQSCLPAMLVRLMSARPISMHAWSLPDSSSWQADLRHAVHAGTVLPADIQKAVQADRRLVEMGFRDMLLADSVFTDARAASNKENGLQKPGKPDPLEKAAENTRNIASFFAAA